MNAPTMVSDTTFRERAAAFLHAHAERRRSGDVVSGWGSGADDIGLLDPVPDAEAEARAVEAGRAWRRLAYDHGFGTGHDLQHDEEYRRLERDFEVPDQQPFATGTHLVAPAIRSHGSDDLQARFVPGIHRGDLICCQLLSEPEAGSDLAAIRTTARRDGDEWVVNGQKVWTSQAHFSDVGQLVARTDPDPTSRHRGLTMFLVDMRAPGVTVRPLRQATGESHFNEVFLDDVRIPDRDRVGEPGSGWAAVMETLQAERSSVGAGANNAAVDPVARLVDLARHVGRTHDPLVRQALARLHTASFLRERLTEAHGSITKLLFSDQVNACGDLAGELLGPSLTADRGEWGTFAWTRWVTGAPMMRIAGGTDEIQRNTLAERVLGLPREPRP